jgi:hypothetical protein
MHHEPKSAPAPVPLREDAPISPTAARARRYALTAAVLRAAMEETGCSVRQLAAAIGDGTTTRVEGWRDGVKGLSLDALSLFPAGLHERVLARLSEAKRAQTAERRAVLPVPTHLMHATSALGEFAHVAAEALADGVVDEKEAAAMKKCTQRIRLVVDHVSFDLDRAVGS